MKLRTVSSNGWPAWKMQKYSEFYFCLAYWKWDTPVCCATKGVFSEYQVFFQNANLRKGCNLYIWFSVSIVEISLKDLSECQDYVYTGLREQSETQKNISYKLYKLPGCPQISEDRELSLQIKLFVKWKSLYFTLS